MQTVEIAAFRDAGTAAAGRRCHAHGTGKELQRRCGDDFEADGMSDNSSNEPRPPKLIRLVVARVGKGDSVYPPD
jgi:hypothetical protein